MTSQVPSAKEREPHSDKSFPAALGELLREIQFDPVANPLGRVNLTEFFKTVEGYDYNTLRKMLAGERNLRPDAIEAISEAVSKALGRIVKPDYFREYRVFEVVGMLEEMPELVDDCYTHLATRYMTETGSTELPSGSRRRPYRRRPI